MTRGQDGNDSSGGGMDRRQRMARRNRLTALAAGAVVAGMVGLSFASVPLYRLFCQVTGYGGTTRVAAEAPAVVGSRTVTVLFNADTAGGMPWRFRPAQRRMTLKVGEPGLAFYTAHNPTDRRIVGTASFNVTPAKAGAYFNKIDCFCFSEQALAPGQAVDMPVSFFVDPAIERDPNMGDVHEITLSYTFFERKDLADGGDAGLQKAGGGAASRAPATEYMTGLVRGS